MADVEHNAADRTTNSGKGVHPQLGRSDVADASTRIALPSSSADKGRFVLQTDDGTIHADEGTTGLWRPVTHPAAYGKLYSPAQIAAAGAYWGFDGNSTDDGPNGLTLSEDVTPVYALQGGMGLPQPDGLAPGTRQCLNMLGENLEFSGDNTATWDPLRTTGAFTFMAWLNVTAAQSSGVTALFSMGAVGGAATANINYSIGMNGTVPICVHEHGTGTLKSAQSTTILYSPLSVWTHLAVTRAANGNDYKFYKNGMFGDLVSTATPPDSGTAAVLYVANRSSANHGKGLMTGVLFKAAEMTEAEIMQHFYYGSKGR